MSTEEEIILPEARDHHHLYLTLGIYGTLFLLGGWGCLAVHNATMYNQYPMFFLKRQICWLILSMGVLFAVSKIQFQYYKKYCWLIAALSYIPVLAVLIWGQKINGMTGWFKIGSFTFQPSEFSKAPFVLLLSCVACGCRTSLRSFVLMLSIAAGFCLPIILQPDFGTVIVYIFAFLCLYFIAGGKWKYLLMLGAGVLVLGGCMLYTKPYVLARFVGFFNPEADALNKGWHVLQFRHSIASGGITGQGFGNAVWSNAYLPFAHSDSLFASFTEAVGFIGAVPVILGFITVTWCAVRIAHSLPHESSRLFVFTYAFMICFQAFIHISVNVTLMPPTGITLPLLSYGGSSLLSTFVGFGIAMSAARLRE